MSVEKLIDKAGLVPILKILSDKSICSYTEIKENCELNPQTLSRRLRELQEFDFIERNVQENRSVEYSLTKKGEKLIKLFQELDQLF